MLRDNYDIMEPARSKGREVARFIIELLIIVAIMLGIRYYLIKPFYVKGASMEPNFHDHQYLVIDELTYRFNQPQRGDIVVFRYPKDPKQFFIKRVVGLPGEHVKIENGGVYLIGADGQAAKLDEKYLPEGVMTELPLKGYSDIVLGPGEFFVLGDNRTQSLDSRIFGPVQKDFIVGRAWIRAWPLNTLTVFESPKY